MTGPDWTCAACGSSGPFRSVTYDNPGEPIEYDMECACGSLDVRESAREAAHVMGDRLDSAVAEKERYREALEKIEDGILRIGGQTVGDAEWLRHLREIARAALNPTPETTPEQSKEGR